MVDLLAQSHGGELPAVEGTRASAVSLGYGIQDDMALDILRRAVHRTRATFSPPGKAIRKLLEQDDDSLKVLAKALDGVWKDSYSQEEHRWIERLEELRNNLCSSPTEISIRLYSVGRTSPKLTAEERDHGRVVVRTIGETCRIASVPYKWSLLLFKLIREFRPSVCVELGTCLGISAAYQAAALEMNRWGRLVTLEGADCLASLAMRNFDHLGLGRHSTVVGRFQDTLEGVLRENAPIDFVFIDGHHEEHPTVAYFRQFAPHLSDGAVLVFDDIHWSPGMDRAWRRIRTDGNIKLALDAYRVGICIVANSPTADRTYFRVGL